MKVTLLFANRTLYGVFTLPKDAKPGPLLKHGPHFFTPCTSGTNDQLHGIDVYIETEVKDLGAVT